MKDYKAKRIYANGEKHVVYYIHTDCGTAYSLGWDTEEIAQIVREDSHLSISVGIQKKMLTVARISHSLL